MRFVESKDPKKIQDYVNKILNAVDLSDHEKTEVARKIITQTPHFGHKELGFGLMVRDFGDEHPGVKNASIDKNFDEITVEFPTNIKNTKIGADHGANWVTFMMETDKNGEYIDIRVCFHKDDKYYFDEPPGCDVIVVKREDQKPDKELRGK